MTDSVKKHRTPVFIETVNVNTARVTPGGMKLPAGSVEIELSDLPGPLAATAAPGGVFFAYVNLAAEVPEDVGIERIEEHWASTGPLHFDLSAERDEALLLAAVQAPPEPGQAVAFRLPMVGLVAGLISGSVANAAERLRSRGLAIQEVTLPAMDPGGEAVASFNVTLDRVAYRVTVEVAP